MYVNIILYSSIFKKVKINENNTCNVISRCYTLNMVGDATKRPENSKGDNMNISARRLKKMGACSDGLDWFRENYGTKNVNAVDALRLSLRQNKHSDCNWFLSTALNRGNKIRYACYAAKQVLEIFEDQYPNEKRPRQAINAALKCIKNDTNKNREAARAASGAAWTAASEAASDAANEAARTAASEAAWAAWAAARTAASEASEAARTAASEAARAAWAAASEAAMYKKIIARGIKLLQEQEIK